MQGKIIKILSNQYTIYDQGKRIAALAMGKLRLGSKPLVGDNVEYDLINDRYCIDKIYPRENYLFRPAISNVDQAMIVMSAKSPDFSSVLVDRLIFLISYYHIEPLIVVSKMDLAEENDEVYKYIADYRKSGYRVILIGHDYNLADLKKALAGKVTVLAGQSGVGKSSLLNKLDEKFALHTQEISKALNRGKHTTRHTELYEVCGGWLADTPGFSSLDFSSIKASELAARIKDFKIEKSCKFNDCIHLNEPGCAIKEAVAQGKISAYRYKNYADVLALCDQRKEWEL
ncbi:MAG: ribosome small subunit-dependent GTPase A [Erysipelotrichia bacterium]|nr:ribosome small subunit-dependent GTPase A [Erysipelotrichia bacterium]